MPQENQPSKDKILLSLEAHVQYELAEFADLLNAARWIWKNAPELLTAERFPVTFSDAFFLRHGHEPDESIPMLADVTKPDLRRRLWPYAVQSCLPVDHPLWGAATRGRENEFFAAFPFNSRSGI